MTLPANLHGNSDSMHTATDQPPDALQSIIARSGGSVVVPFSRIEPDAPRSYKPLEAPVTLSAEQLNGIFAVLSHIAFHNNINQEQLLCDVEKEFSVTHIAKILASEAENVMEFLIDLRLKNVRSRR